MSRSAPVEVTRSIAAPPGAVWALLSTPGHLADCHPFCRENLVEAWPGPGSRDEIAYFNGRHVTRSVTSWLDGEGFDVSVSDSGGLLADVSWRIGDAAAGSRLTLTLVPRMLDAVPRLVRPVWGIVARWMLRRYLRSVVRGVEWTVTRSEPVRRNQFGSHRWFSRRGT
jgi:uncharacterized protein YndB with AHSA1/START domain